MLASIDLIDLDAHLLHAASALPDPHLRTLDAIHIAVELAASGFILDGMESLDHATLSSQERAVLERFSTTLRERLRDELHAIWLFGSRARGERIGALSDIDLLVIADDATWDGTGRVYEALHDAAREIGEPNAAWNFSIHVHDPTWIDRRRAVESFFITEVERDHIDLTPAA